jgi:hypothetical protein
MKSSRGNLELGKPKMREISEKLWPTSVYIMCIYEYESAAEKACELDSEIRLSRAFFESRKIKRKSRKERSPR